MSAHFDGSLLGESTPLPHFWEHTVGSGHATLGLRADWQAQLKRAHHDLGMQHVRFHGILSDDMGT
jgi:xylan 1,4-beta-xylosidase